MTAHHRQKPNPVQRAYLHAMGSGRYAQFTVNRAGGAALGTKRRPFEKIERDGDNARLLLFSFLSNNQPKDGVRSGGGYWEGVGQWWNAWVFSSFGAMACATKKIKKIMSRP